MQLRRPILLHILLEDIMDYIKKSQPSPNIKTTNGERLDPAGELSFSDNLDIEQFNTFISGLQLKFGISKRDLLEQPIHLKVRNIGIPFCSLSIRTFAFKYEFR